MSKADLLVKAEEWSKLKTQNELSNFILDNELYIRGEMSKEWAEGFVSALCALSIIKLGEIRAEM